ncbi:alpha-S2-casein-like [Nomascus leucogenys]|uniref:alpha-S2-casein-like n=1 Tax=Nomascus leucogenys TaxID=61853 RepID=UPI0002ADB7DF|nr:alpha-S2-casein-like [Nomascus leucogenys]
MKFFIFTCLLAVALAHHEIEHSSFSSEESASIYQKETANKIDTMQSSSSLSSEESAQVSTENNELTKEERIYLKQMESTSISQEESAEVFPGMKTNQFLQKFTVPQYVQAVPLVVYEPVESQSGRHLPIYSHLEERVRFLN